ncbi:hypothetical protein ADN00_04905 [Ornatilinea apprima]|uniref:Uncharacterized protein n=1 Tax=Ornatilinea apprima TaxID=1134406 RepID=A0A0P6XVB8_9CHLR|nr:hypothetical protein ADN00_04905 [Ornatilinea apprima]
MGHVFLCGLRFILTRSGTAIGKCWASPAHPHGFYPPAGQKHAPTFSKVILFSVGFGFVKILGLPRLACFHHINVINS